MTISRRLLIGLLGGAAAVAGSGAAIFSVAAMNKSDDLAKLGRLLTLAEPPAAATFETGKVGSGGPIGPDDWWLVAVLDYPAAVVERLFAAAPVTTPAGTPLGVMLPDWAQARLGGLLQPGDGAARVLAVPRHAATAFARSPLSAGFMARLEDGTGVLVYLMTS